MKTLGLLAVAALSLEIAPPQEESGKTYSSFLGKAPPELQVPEGGWFNASTPLSLEKLRGKVVWLEFSFST
jgi:hypothetical protein